MLRTDEGWTASRVAEALDVSERTVRRAKRRYVEEGLEEVLRHHNSPNPYRKVDDKVEANLIALACSPAPDGQDHWTLRALAGKAVELGLVESLSHETVRLHLKKTPSSRGGSSNGASPRPRWGVRSGHGGCPGTLRRTLRSPEASGLLRRDLHPTAGRNQGSHTGKARTGPRREDYEYVRAGTRNLFLICEPKAGWRHVAITQRRTMQDFAHQMRWLVDEAYPDVPVIRLVLDNLNTHRMASLYETFPAPEARRIARRLEFHHTHKHGSWLNMAEIELSVLARPACGDATALGSLEKSVEGCVSDRNKAAAIINWRFTAKDARRKIHRLYPCHN